MSGGGGELYLEYNLTPAGGEPNKAARDGRASNVVQTMANPQQGLLSQGNYSSVGSYNLSSVVQPVMALTLAGLASSSAATAGRGNKEVVGATSTDRLAASVLKGVCQEIISQRHLS